MSNFTADTLMPLFSALPEEERHVFVEKAKKMLTPAKPKPRKRSTMDKIADQLGEEWRDGNEEMMLTKIMNGTL